MKKKTNKKMEYTLAGNLQVSNYWIDPGGHLGWDGRLVAAQLVHLP